MFPITAQSFNIEIKTIEEYRYCVARGYQPLHDAIFSMDIDLRKQIQNDLFHDDEAFFRWCWLNKQHLCEETFRPLHEYSAVHISHILSRGAFPEMRYDPRNVNILSLQAHNQWEFGDRTKMRIYQKNQVIIQKLKSEYGSH